MVFSQKETDLTYTQTDRQTDRDLDTQRLKNKQTDVPSDGQEGQRNA